DAAGRLRGCETYAKRTIETDHRRETYAKRTIKTDHRRHLCDRDGVAVLNSGGMNDGLHQQPLCVDEKMTLLALDLLSRTEPVRIDRGPPFSALLTPALAVDNGGGGAGFAFDLLATLFVCLEQLDSSVFP